MATEGIRVGDRVVPMVDDRMPQSFLRHAGVVVSIDDDGERCKVWSEETNNICSVRLDRLKLRPEREVFV